MKWHEKIGLLFHVLGWRLTWSRIRLDYAPRGPVSRKFITARQAAALIPDGAVVFSSGIAGNARCTTFYFAIRDRFQRYGHPSHLTWINGGAQGSRGRVPGTVEDLGLPGLMDTYIAAHLETTKAQLSLGETGQLKIHTLPQGVVSLLLEEQGKGRSFLRSAVGLDTFLDPTFGKGSAVTPNSDRSFIRRESNSLLYQMPKVDIALFNLPYADAEGNLYFHHSATLTETLPSLRAARANGGKVMATVSGIIPKLDRRIGIPAKQVDYIVVNPFNEQVASVRQRKYWDVFTPETQGNIHRAVEKLDFINSLLRITPVRTPVGWMIGRLAARQFIRVVPNGAMINIGVGYPEEVVRLLVEHGLEKEFIFTTEAGSFGGLPAPGIFFGAAIYPDHLESSSTMFERYRDSLGAAVLGFLQVDSDGNVNVSKRGPSITDYVGPGGFPDIVNGAKKILFTGTWMHGAKVGIEKGMVRFRQHGTPKFVPRVDEVTFNGRSAIEQGKEVYYVTDVGVFQLMPNGLQLRSKLPGIDLERDILQCTRATIDVPEPSRLETVGQDVVTGRDFQLRLSARQSALV